MLQRCICVLPRAISTGSPGVRDRLTPSRSISIESEISHEMQMMFNGFFLLFYDPLIAFFLNLLFISFNRDDATEKNHLANTFIRHSILKISF
jgi:hypothetical protein